MTRWALIPSPTLVLLAAAAATGGCTGTLERSDAGIPADARPDGVCADVVCAPDATCQDVAGEAVCACDDGFEGDGLRLCEDVDECAEGRDDCPGDATCVNTDGGFRCDCAPGFAAVGGACRDVDECAEGLDDCAPDAACLNAEGSFSCACRPGFEGDGRTCADIDECAGSPCDPAGLCRNEAGSFACACPAGYLGDGFRCADVDECAQGLDTCAPDATCTNAPGSFACTCNDGFRGDGATCADIDECAEAVDDCDDNASCTNGSGSFSCRCDEGYAGDGRSCEDVDECAEGLDDCDPEASCTNEVGSFACACNEGFEGDGTVCLDIDECAQGLDDCDDNATCTNDPGSFTCTCNAGFLPTPGAGCEPAFDIVIEFENTPTTSQRAAFEDAEAKWESLIVGDLADFTVGSSFCGVTPGRVVDDLVIVATLEPIDGRGRILGQAGPRCIRSTLGGTVFLPATGIMRFDTDDLAFLESTGRLEGVILHEMGHVLGIGTGWDNLGLLLNPSCGSSGCSSGNDTRFTGANAVAGWQLLGGTGDVPVENSLGRGSSDAHWRENGPLREELMSPQLSTVNALSLLTLRSLRDLGYSIAADSRADPFSLPPLLLGPPPPALDLGDDIDHGPVYEATPTGLRRIR
ncbi:MAG: EGF domain-containing protein [Sandaracinaceae bacterium]